MKLFQTILLSFVPYVVSAQVIPDAGQWQGVIQYEQEDVNFSFTISHDPLILTIINGDEQIPLEPVIIGDSIVVRLKPFDAELRAKYSKHQIEGNWIKGYKKNKPIPFKASYGEPRFRRSVKPNVDLNGKWSINLLRPFSLMATPTVGLFNQNNSSVTGTLLTEVGDYRYLAGVVYGDSVLMSSFDGVHAFQLKAAYDGDSIRGAFIFDNNYTETVIGFKNENASIPEPFEQVADVERPFYDILFSVEEEQPDLSQYFDKVVVMQIFGTWCPNSMDQVRMLNEYYQDKPDEVEFMAITYEPNFSIAYGDERIRNYINDMAVQYPVYLGGKLSKSEAALAFPNTHKLNAFPTLVILDKQGIIRYTSNYFNGPATGSYNRLFIERFQDIIDQLVNE